MSPTSICTSPLVPAASSGLGSVSSHSADQNPNIRAPVLLSSETCRHVRNTSNPSQSAGSGGDWDAGVCVGRRGRRAEGVWDYSI